MINGNKKSKNKVKSKGIYLKRNKKINKEEDKEESKNMRLK